MRDTTILQQPRVNPIAAVFQRPLVQAFFNDTVTLISGIFLAITLLAVIFAPLFSPHDPNDQQVALRHLPPLATGNAIIKESGAARLKEERFYLLGTDHVGRDMLSRLIYGGRISITVGFLGVFASGSIGVFLGLLAGYYRGAVDDIIMRAVDVFMTVPLLFLALMVIFILVPRPAIFDKYKEGYN